MNRYRSLWQWIARHALVSSCAALAILGGGWWAYGKFFSVTPVTKYVLTSVKRGMIVASVSATGQIVVSSQADLKPKVSAAVTSVAVHEGDAVKAGQAIAYLDAQDAAKAVRDAKANLESVQIALTKLMRPADAYALLQAENSLTQAKQAKQNAESGVTKAYEDGFTSVASAFIDFPAMMTGLNTILTGMTINGNQTNVYAYFDLVSAYSDSSASIEHFRDSALFSNQAAQAAYAKNLADYKGVTRNSDHAAVGALISETYDTARSISDAVKNAKNFLDVVSDTLAKNAPLARLPSAYAGHVANLQSYTGTVNASLAGLLAAKTALETNANAVANGSATIAERAQSLADLRAGADALDVKSQKLAVTERQNALMDAEESLGNYVIRSPFAGIVAKLNLKKGDQASSGTIAASVITSDRMAQVSLNEVDVARVKVGQKATLSFDAIESVTVAGHVAQVDALGTVTQGVVTYGVQIVPDAQDERVRPGMSVSAAIITDAKDGALMVPAGAVKSKGGRTYVEVADVLGIAGDPFAAEGVTLLVPVKQQDVTLGLASDTMAEIVSGVNEGDTVVVRTIAAVSAAPAASSVLGGLRLPGVGGGGAFRGGR